MCVSYVGIIFVADPETSAPPRPPQSVWLQRLVPVPSTVTILSCCIKTKGVVCTIQTAMDMRDESDEEMLGLGEDERENLLGGLTCTANLLTTICDD